MGNSVAISIIGIILALAILLVGALKGYKLFLLVIISSFVVIVTNRMDAWQV